MSNATVLSVHGLGVDITMPSGTLHAVDDVDLSVSRGETMAVVGESGCGKTMTALAIMRLLPRQAALRAHSIRLDGEDLHGISDRDFADLRGDRISMVFQDPMTSLNPVYTVGNQLEEIFIRHGKGNRRAARERALHLLDRVGIPNATARLDQFPHHLSGGLRQRVMIAMALMCEPSLIVADEPTTALDVTVQAQILRLLAELQSELDMAILLITHDLGVVARTANRVAVMYAGRIVESGTTGQLFTTPLHPYTRGLIECIPRPGASKESLRAIPGMVPTLIGPLKGCMFRSRCHIAEDRCRLTGNEQREAEGGHTYRCIHPVERLLSYRGLR